MFFKDNFKLLWIIFIMILHMMQIRQNSYTKQSWIASAPSFCLVSFTKASKCTNGSVTTWSNATKMDFLTWASVNGPVGAVNVMMNAFFIFCMVNPLHGEKIKQPLKLLLALLIGSTTVYLVATFGVFFTEGNSDDVMITLVSFLISISCLNVSISSFVWLNFFYYTQIVPAQRALFVWIKKNIKPIIFGIIIFENVFSFLDLTVALMNTQLVLSEFNETTNCQNQIEKKYIQYQEDIYIILISIQKFHFYSSFFVMMMSSGATVVYLCRHMQHMVAHGQSFSGPRFSSQVRVTITGIIQGFHFLALTVWREYNFVSIHFSNITIGPYIFSTAINFYMSATAFCLGAGQVVFRQRAADMWTRAVQWCKDLTVQPPQGAWGPEDTLNLHSHLQGCKLHVNLKVCGTRQRRHSMLRFGHCWSWKCTLKQTTNEEQDMLTG